jgi:alanyl-tRNA synthetase
VLGAIEREERQFNRTLEAGVDQLEEALISLTSEERVIGRREEDLSKDAPVLPGAIAFRLHDTYGFPIDLTIELAAEYGVRVDLAGFQDSLAEQRDRSRAGTKAALRSHAELQSLYESIARRAGDSQFLGYETTSADGRVVAILRDGIEYEELTGAGAAEVVLDRTPFYPEGGGQVGDRGRLREQGGGSDLFTVEDTQKPVGGLIVHRGRLHGRLRVGETITAEVDAERRAHTMRNHTGTHVLHRALRNIVGESARQAGSLVAPEYLRFDFPFDRPLTDDEKRAIEAEVRRVVREDRPVSAQYMTMPEAIAAGADAFFDEKYGEQVRTVRVTGYSHELCGGTHCRASGQIGSFVITGERSIGSGMRRIEALTGEAADRLLAERSEALERIASQLGAQNVEAVPDRIAALQEELREAKRRLRAGAAGGLRRPAEVAAGAREIAPSVRLAAYAGPYESIDALKGAARDVRDLLGDGIVALGLDADEPQVFVTVSDDLAGRGVSAGALVQAAVAEIDGRGGGRPTMAQGKGTRREGLGRALEIVAEQAVAAIEASG